MTCLVTPLGYNVGSGRLLLAVVLPFRPFVEDGPRKTPPTEKLGLDPNGDFETSITGLYERVSIRLLAVGFFAPRVR